MVHSDEINGYVLETPTELRLIRQSRTGWVIAKRVSLERPVASPQDILHRLSVGKALIDMVPAEEIGELKEKIDIPITKETKAWAYRGPNPNARVAEDVLTGLLRARSVVWFNGESGQYEYRALGLAIKWGE